MELVIFQMPPVNNVRTVSDTKRAFYSLHTRPINSLYRRVVEELMVEMHLLSVNADFAYDPIYALGVVTTFDCFMQGYRPESDKDSIFNALCQAIGSDPQVYRHDAQQLRELASRLTPSELGAKLAELDSQTTDGIQEYLRAIAHNPKFKYSRLFAIGLYTLLECMEQGTAKDDKQRMEALVPVCTALKLPEEKLQKDLELYRSNLEKMAQAQSVMEDMLQAERKKREERMAQKQDTVATQSNSTPE